MSERSAWLAGISMPEWLLQFEDEAARKIYKSDEEKLRLASLAALKNVQFGTGGPFGAALFDAEDKLISIGVNRVVPCGQFWAHAEMAALAIAQKKSGLLHLTNCTLASSCEPCAMCMGGIPWSGISTLLYSAPGTEAEKIGFDEGAKPENWQNSYEKRGIKVIGPLFPEAGEAALRLYARNQGKIY